MNNWTEVFQEFENKKNRWKWYAPNEHACKNCWYFLRFMENVNWLPSWVKSSDKGGMAICYNKYDWNGHNNHQWGPHKCTYSPQFDYSVRLDFGNDDYNRVIFSNVKSYRIGDWHDLLNDMRDHFSH